MKKLSMLAIIIALGLGTSVMAETNVAVIDVQQVVAKSSQVQALKKEQEKKMADLQKWLITARADVEKQKTEEGKAKLIKKYDAEFVKKQTAIRKSYTEKLQEIDKSINATIEAEAKAKGYDMIITKGVVIYGGNDITADIIKAIK